MSFTSYTVYYIYSKKYNPERALYGTLTWEWLSRPQTWEDYEPVRTFIKVTENACRVMLYAVMTDEEKKRFKGVKQFLYQNGERKLGLYKPWGDHDFCNGKGCSGDSRKLAWERGADESARDC